MSKSRKQNTKFSHRNFTRFFALASKKWLKLKIKALDVNVTYELKDCDHKNSNISKLNVLYSKNSKGNFLLIGMSFNQEKCLSEMR